MPKQDSKADRCFDIIVTKQKKNKGEWLVTVQWFLEATTAASSR